MIKNVALIGFGVVLASMLACKPEWLSDNTFLRAFVSFEILSLLAVILTVTLASVANIHLSINRIIIRHLSGNSAQSKVAEEIKSEIKTNAWVIFYSFFFAVLILFVKGLNESDATIVSACNAAMLWVLFLNLMCILDIYKVIYGIVDLEAGFDTTPPTPDAPDFNSEGKWISIYKALHETADAPYSYEDLSAAVDLAGHDASSGGQRTQMMNAVKAGWFDRVGHGKFEFTESGLALIGADPNGNSGSAEPEEAKSEDAGGIFAFQNPNQMPPRQ